MLRRVSPTRRQHSVWSSSTGLSERALQSTFEKLNAVDGQSMHATYVDGFVGKLGIKEIVQVLYTVCFCFPRKGTQLRNSTWVECFG